MRRVAANFDLCQINPVKISRRGNVNYVFNGQHTIETVATVSGSRDTPVWCMVYDEMDYQQEADIFANQLRYTKALTPHEIFFANVEVGNDKQLIIKEIVESYHLVLTPHKMQGGICAIAALEFIYDRQGYHALDRTLRMAVNTWEGEPNSFSSNMLKGLARLIAAYGEDIKDDQFIEKVGAFSVKEIIRNAKDRGGGTLGHAEILLSKYNHRMKMPLKQELLYISGPSAYAASDKNRHSEKAELGNEEE